MRIKFRLTGILLFAVLAQTGPGAAAICEGPGEMQTTQDGQSVARPVTALISVCVLEDDFSADRFPRFYQVLRRGLAQPENRAEFLEAALRMGNRMARTNRLDRAEALYPILLAQFPGEARVLSSYAAINMMQYRLNRATGLIYRALEADPRDPLILGNGFVIAVLNADFIRADQVVQLQIEQNPEDTQNRLRKALLASVLNAPDTASSWQALLDAEVNPDNRLYWEYVEESMARANPNEVLGIADGLIDANFVIEAIIVLDWIAQQGDSVNAYYFKARALEAARRYKLAYAAATEAERVYLRQSDLNDTFYQGLLYNRARLAYAANNYTTSLRLLDQFRLKGYLHPALDYMYAVNFTALGNLIEARPYLERCAGQNLANDVNDYCAQVLSSVSESNATRDIDEKPAAITISSIAPGPAAYLDGFDEQLPVQWLGLTRSRKISATDSGVSIVWIAEYLQPEGSYEIKDNRAYEIRIETTQSRPLFEVSLQLPAADDAARNTIREQFGTREKFILVDGTTSGVTLIDDRLVPRVRFKHAILTSTLSLIESPAKD